MLTFIAVITILCLLRLLYHITELMTVNPTRIGYHWASIVLNGSLTGWGGWLLMSN